MNDYKIAFFDIDGTLIDMETKKMTERMRHTLLQLKENGVILCIATGRPLRSVPKFQNPSFDVYLTFNGSYCTAGDKVIYKQPIDSRDVEKIIANAAAMHRPVSLAGTDEMAANGTDRDLDDYFAFSRQKVEISKNFGQLAKKDIYQIMMGASKDDFDAILSGVKSAKITAWWDRAVDIIPIQSGKGAAVKNILEYFHLDAEQAIAFGDGENDIEMLNAVGKGVVMGNANETMKKMFSDICKPVSEDGIYHYCVSHGIISSP